ncbi:CNNM domain-containing protein, partial [Burkholderia sp. Ac-20384]|uniref:CNNM domain-containing protein n=1 Tax=Burkholderia sp. Ac-20384 TaxID=2703902 RepID=UPI00197DA88E
MSLLQNFMIIIVLSLTSSLCSISESAWAGARKSKLKLLAESGDDRDDKVLKLQENSDDFFATSHIGLNAVAILGFFF